MIYVEWQYLGNGEHKLRRVRLLGVCIYKAEVL